MPEIQALVVRTGQPSPLVDVGPHNTVQAPDAPWRVVFLEGGMSSGAPSVAVVIPLDEENFVLAESSLLLWASATVIARAAFPEAFAGGPLAVPESGPGGLSAKGVFTFERGDDWGIESAVNQALAAASLTWTLTPGPADGAPGSAMFDAEAFTAISNALLAVIAEETF